VGRDLVLAVCGHHQRKSAGSRIEPRHDHTAFATLCTATSDQFSGFHQGWNQEGQPCPTNPRFFCKRRVRSYPPTRRTRNLNGSSVSAALCNLVTCKRSGAALNGHRLRCSPQRGRSVERISVRSLGRRFEGCATLLLNYFKTPDCGNLEGNEPWLVHLAAKPACESSEPSSLESKR
jgi:hypothetical protein